jgi:hypothetical protein
MMGSLFLFIPSMRANWEYSMPVLVEKRG